MTTGFIYLWLDKKNSKFYLGSHFGAIDDGYIGSGVHFSRAYKRRPQDFKRRVLAYSTGSKTELRQLEEKWLNLITDRKLAERYYNLNRQALGGSMKGRICKPLSEESKAKLRKPKSEATKLKMKKPKSEAHRKAISEALKRAKLDHKGPKNSRYGAVVSEETRRKISEAHLARKPSLTPEA